MADDAAFAAAATERFMFGTDLDEQVQALAKAAQTFVAARYVHEHEEDEAGCCETCDGLNERVWDALSGIAVWAFVQGLNDGLGRR